MAMLHYQRVGADTLGTAVGTLETIGTITIPSNATNVWGIIGQRAHTAAPTTAEAVIGSFIVNPRTLGYQTFRFSSATLLGSTGATNNDSMYDAGMWIPFRSSTGRPPANEQVTFQYDTEIATPTTEDYAQVFLLSSNGGIDPKVLENRGIGLSAIKSWCDWSATATDADIGNATSEVMAQTISVPGSVKLIHSAIVSIASDAVTTAGEHFVGYISLSGTIPNLDPMDIPMPAVGASLGTAPNMPWNGMSYVYPLYIPGTGKNETITLTANIAATTSGVYGVTVTLLGSV